MGAEPRLVLVSASPRRRDLLARLVDSFDCAASSIEEDPGLILPDRELPHLPLSPPFTVEHYADPRLWAWRKVRDFLNANDRRRPSGSQLVLASDTTVVAPGEVLNKPRDEADALRMLMLLSGSEHYVVTGYALTLQEGSESIEIGLGAEMARVVMRKADITELKQYVASGEPFDKAGAYAVQGRGGSLVEEVQGCYTAVVGLPLCAVRAALAAIGVPLQPVPPSGYCSACAQRGLPGWSYTAQDASLDKRGENLIAEQPPARGEAHSDVIDLE